MAARSIIVHDIGPDGESTYELVEGQDIDATDAQELISRSGGSTVYAMHHYEAGKRVESFISKKMFDTLRAATIQINSHRRSLDDIEAEISKALSPTRKPWWAFWR